VYRHQRLIILAVVAVMIGLGIGVPLSRSLGGGPTLAPPRISGYQIVYRLEAPTNAAPAQWEVLSVRRPFESADLVYGSAGPPTAADRPTSGSISTESELYAVDTSGVHDVGGRQPGPPSADQDLATQLADMLHRHLAADTGGTSQVAGRSCRTYRLLEPPVGPMRPLGVASEHDDLCIDGNGLVLSEAWTLDGRLVERRTATAVSVATVSLPSVDGASPPKPGASRAVVAPDAEGPVALPRPPPGFHALAPVRFALPDPLHPSSLVAASVVWTYVDGSDLVTVEAGSEQGGQLPWQQNDTVTEPLELTGLGPAQSAIRSDGAEIRVDLGGGRWMRIRGTESASILSRYANNVHLLPSAAG
jgi:hypothetical protein